MYQRFSISNDPFDNYFDQLLVRSRLARGVNVPKHVDMDIK